MTYDDRTWVAQELGIAVKTMAIQGVPKNYAAVWSAFPKCPARKAGPRAPKIEKILPKMAF